MDYESALPCDVSGAAVVARDLPLRDPRRPNQGHGGDNGGDNSGSDDEGSGDDAPFEAMIDDEACDQKLEIRFFGEQKKIYVFLEETQKIKAIKISVGNRIRVNPSDITLLKGFVVLDDLDIVGDIIDIASGDAYLIMKMRGVGGVKGSGVIKKALKEKKPDKLLKKIMFDQQISSMSAEIDAMCEMDFTVIADFATAMEQLKNGEAFPIDFLKTLFDHNSIEQLKEVVGILKSNPERNLEAACGVLMGNICARGNHIIDKLGKMMGIIQLKLASIITINYTSDQGKCDWARLKKEIEDIITYKTMKEMLIAQNLVPVAVSAPSVSTETAM